MNALYEFLMEETTMARQILFKVIGINKLIEKLLLAGMFVGRFSDRAGQVTISEQRVG